MVDVPHGSVVESKTTEKTTGGIDLPNTKSPKTGEAYNTANAPYKHDAQDVSKYIGVTSEYRTYGDVRNQPFGVAGDVPVYLSGEGPGVEVQLEQLDAEAASRKQAREEQIAALNAQQEEDDAALEEQKTELQAQADAEAAAAAEAEAEAGGEAPPADSGGGEAPVPPGNAPPPPLT